MKLMLHPSNRPDSPCGFVRLNLIFPPLLSMEPLTTASDTKLLASPLLDTFNLYRIFAESWKNTSFIVSSIMESFENLSMETSPAMPRLLLASSFTDRFS